jgi:hypothetical protein
MFAWLRAPSRFGVVVCFALSVLAGVAVSTLLRGMRDGRRAGLAAAGLAAVAAAELIVPLRSRRCRRSRTCTHAGGVATRARHRDAVLLPGSGVVPARQLSWRRHPTGCRSSTATAISSRRISPSTS